LNSGIALVKKTGDFTQQLTRIPEALSVRIEDDRLGFYFIFFHFPFIFSYFYGRVEDKEDKV